MASLQFDGAGFEFVKGVPKYFRSSVAGRRAFCEECGSPILFKYEANMDVWVLLGALDEPGRWPMTSDATWGKTVHFHVNNKNPWEVISPGLRQLTTETPFRDEGEQLAASGAR